MTQPTIFPYSTVCVTGAGGSIGSEICRQLIGLGVRKLVLISLTEAGLYDIERKLRAIPGHKTEIVPLLGSVTDEGLLRDALNGVDIVIHAAAHKHVPLCEKNPIAAIRNNVEGTYRLGLAAAAAGVKRFVLISSDKAVKPTSVMGATKRVAELLLRSCMPPRCETTYTVVRFGNVLDSAGSVLPLWREQIAQGREITLTDERCERYFMSIPEAAQLTLSALTLPEGTYIFDMGKPVNMYDLLMETMYKAGKDVPIRIVGLREGEKLTEELTYGGTLRPTIYSKIFSVSEGEGKFYWTQLQAILGAAKTRRTELALRELWDAVR